MTSLINTIDQTINFNDQTIRIVGTYDSPMFVASDICKILGLTNVTETIRSLPDKWKKICDLSLSEVTSTARKTHEMNCISEAGLYKIIMRSNKPIAQKFQEVVCEEILPSIRKTGEFKLQQMLEEKDKLLQIKEQEKNKISVVLNEQKKELKSLHSLVKRKKKRKYSFAFCVYIISNPDIHNSYKIGSTKNRNERLDGLLAGAPLNYKIEYSRKLCNVKDCTAIESLLLSIFETYRVVNDTHNSMSREWVKNVDLNLLKDELDMLVDYFHCRKNIHDADFAENNIQVKDDIVVEEDKIKTKLCYTCKQEKNLNEYYDKIENVDGKEGSCKICYNAYKKILKEEKDQREIIIRDEGTKKCRKCLEIKEFECFSKHGTSTDGYEFVCLDCKNIKQAEKQRCSLCYKTKEVINFRKFRLGFNKFCIDCENEHKDSIEIEEEDIKHCTLCKQDKTLDKFSKCAKKTDGYSQYCSDCSKEKSKEYREKQKNNGTTIVKDIKKCSMCKTEKSMENYYISKNSKDGKKSKCIDCEKKYDKELRLSKTT